MRTPLIAGNWKMNGRRGDAEALARAVEVKVAALSGVEICVCPPFVHLQAVQSVLSGEHVALGAQNCADAGPGARTGEIAAEMLLDYGVSHVILGHSERRAHYGETDEVIAARYQEAQNAGLIPILCVGETLAEREADQTEAIVGGQIRGVTERLEGTGLGNGVIAYEPVWAIGTGRTATADQAEHMHAFIREQLVMLEGHANASARRILYGGSMKPANAGELLAQPDVDGGLIGGASLDADDFVAICAAAQGG
ncbi:MAG: triose-phosphate isomerase [Spiribacter salinus]|uniref:Triosephosphate isomerase n=1 Tax=Spiribacter salinus TaxID=1335746 RepID=A0A540VRS3_9GAMM|nr:triose-phosphate isomerase [Spiribacter sp.]TQE99460.1 MAG: triose-phosphate isomerase [Spiribacter salinus]